MPQIGCIACLDQDTGVRLDSSLGPRNHIMAAANFLHNEILFEAIKANTGAAVGVPAEFARLNRRTPVNDARPRPRPTDESLKQYDDPSVRINDRIHLPIRREPSQLCGERKLVIRAGSLAQRSYPRNDIVATMLVMPPGQSAGKRLE